MPISKEALSGIIRKTDLYYETLADDLSTMAVKSHIEGDLAAQRLTKTKVSMSLVQKESIAYAKTYRKDLIEKGGSWCVNKEGKKEFIQWFAESKTNARRDVVDIIRQGVADGKPIGVKELVGGGYPDGTIAADLHKYFDEHRSHASTVARTEHKKIVYEGMMNRFESQNVQELEYVATVDDRVRPEHLARHGNRYKIGEQPALGEYGCRCTYIPVILEK